MHKIQQNRLEKRTQCSVIAFQRINAPLLLFPVFSLLFHTLLGSSGYYRFLIYSLGSTEVTIQFCLAENLFLFFSRVYGGMQPSVLRRVCTACQAQFYTKKKKSQEEEGCIFK